LSGGVRDVESVSAGKWCQMLIPWYFDAYHRSCVSEAHVIKVELVIAEMSSSSAV